MKYLIMIVVGVMVAIGAGWWFQSQFEQPATDLELPDRSGVGEDQNDQPNMTDDEDEAETESVEPEPVQEIGRSAGGHEILAYHYGDGESEILVIGGIHGGYSANTALLSYELMEWLEADPTRVPDDLTVTVIPQLNPDGVEAVFGSTDRFTASDIETLSDRVPGRFNANEVDLNRNFDCQWQSTGVWRNREVNAGTEPFSEPESQALRDYVEVNNPVGAVVFYSAAGEVIASSCNGEPSALAQDMARVYSGASSYTLQPVFDHYELSGDAADWLELIGMPVISVILSGHTSAEWSQNRSGLEAVLELMSDN